MVKPILYDRLLVPPEQSFFLFGMRGTGKSTWAKKTFPEAARFDLLNEGLFQDYIRNPRMFGKELMMLPEGSRVIVDEIQRLPSLLNEVHRLIEDRGYNFVLLGSSARKLKTAGTNLLAGRALKCVMQPLLPQELADDFDLDEVLGFGSLPLVWNSKNKKTSLEAYIQMYLKEEIQAEALVRNLPGFARFLPIAALFHGQVLNVASVARDAGVARTTVTGYMDILLDTHLGCMLSAYEARLRVREKKHPKFYWTDAGVMRAAKREFHKPTNIEKGPIFKGWIHFLLRSYGEPGTGLGYQYDNLYYWSPQSRGTEVDFLIQRGNSIVAVEVKAKSLLSGKDFAGLKAIGSLKNIKRKIMVFMGERPFKAEENIDVLPVEHFLKELQSGDI
jgi:uncharacterized protein